MARGSDWKWLWVLGPMAGVAALLGAGWLWLTSEADWRRAEARAAAAGIPTGERPARPEVDAASAGDLLLAASTVRALILPRRWDENAWHDEFALLAMHQTERLAALDAAIDRLPERMVRVGNDPWRYDGVERYMIGRVLASRLTCCPAEEMPARLRRAARFVAASGIGYASHWSYSAGALVGAVAARAPELRGTPVGAAAADELAAFLATLPSLTRAELVYHRALDAVVLRVATDPDAMYRFYGGGSPYRFRLPEMLRLRWRREAQLDQLTDEIAALDRHPDPADWPRALAPRLEGRPPTVRNLSGELLLPTSVARLMLHGLTVVAELRGEPWPRDWWDASGGRLRPLLREGRVIGAYCVGANGLDDGGEYGSDDCFALGRERLGRSHPTQAPPPREIMLPRYLRQTYPE